MKKMLLILLMVCAFSLPAFAVGGQEGSFEIGAYGGYGFLDSYGGSQPKDKYLFGARFGWFLDESFSFEPSYQWLMSETSLPAATKLDLQIRSLRFNLLYNFLPDRTVRPFVTGGLGWEQTVVENSSASNDLGVNAGAGLHWFWSDSWALRLDGRYIYTEVDKVNEKEHNFEGALGISYFFGGKPPKDSDEDGVPDKKDTCPSTPKGAVVDTNGCPSDADMDGVYDGLDDCANTPKGTKVDDKGCTLDTDGDGVPDNMDQCANTPKGTPVDDKGCTKDDDVDGVTDDKDQCPNTPVEVKVDEKGCPVDSDGDGVADDKDLCPDTAKGTAVDEKGCPKVTKARGVLKGVNFQSGNAVLLPASKPVLDEVAAALNEFPKVRVEVQGHTDKTGLEPNNLKLSEARARSVMEYLVSKGVARDRFEVKGYGSSKPLSSNKTKAGRLKNRRVELNWLDK